MSNAVAAVAAAPSEPEWAALAAIDWADQKNFWRLLPAGSRQSEAGELDNTPEAVEVWAANLQQRFGGRPIAVILEQTRGALVYMLTKYPHLVLFPVHPTTAARYRETFAPSGAKSDPSDTDSLLDLLLRHRERLRPLRPDTVETRLLHFLVEQRRQTVDEKTRANLRLIDCLKLYFPQVLRWFDDVTSPLVGDLLERWPTLEQLQRAHPGTLRKFFHEHNCRSEEKNAERIAAIQQATSATQDQAVREACVLIAHSLVATLATLRAQIDGFDKRIAKLVADHPDGALFRSLPGAGDVLAPRLIVLLALAVCAPIVGFARQPGQIVGFALLREIYHQSEAARLRIDVKTIYSYVKRGLLPYVKIQSNVRFLRPAILQWMEERQYRPASRSRK